MASPEQKRTRSNKAKEEQMTARELFAETPRKRELMDMTENDQDGSETQEANRVMETVYRFRRTTTKNKQYP